MKVIVILYYEVGKYVSLLVYSLFAPVSAEQIFKFFTAIALDVRDDHDVQVPTSSKKNPCRILNTNGRNRGQ